MKILTIILACLVLGGCSYDLHKTGMDQYLLAEGEDNLYLKDSASRSFKILYMGAGNMIIESNDEAFFMDPFFSNTGFFRGKLKTDTALYRSWKERVGETINTNSVKAGLVAHSHYDHLMDLPMIVSDKAFPNAQNIYGNECVPLMMTNFKESANFTGLTSKKIFTNGVSDKHYEWQHIGSNISFLAIETNHAPHALGVLMMSGKLDSAYFKDNLTEGSSVTKRKRWTVGTNLAFLVDIRNGADTLRLFIQTSGSKSPNGIPPAEVLDKKSVDLAILCYANTPNVKNFPNYLLDSIKRDGKYPPVLMVHWDNFFKVRNQDDPYRLVPFTSSAKVQRRWRKVGYPDPLADHIRMPVPGTLVNVWY